MATFNNILDAKGTYQVSHTANDVATWMFNRMRDAGVLYQQEAVEYIRANFGDSFIYVNEAGNESIDKEVKKLFKKMHGGKAAWDRDQFYWGWTSAIKV